MAPIGKFALRGIMGVDYMYKNGSEALAPPPFFVRRLISSDLQGRGKHLTDLVSFHISNIFINLLRNIICNIHIYSL